MARKFTHDDNICLSTEDPNIIECANKIGLNVPFKRPVELATDTATTDDVIRHALDYYSSKGINYSKVVLLQPTSPLRTEKQLKDAIKLFDHSFDMVASVKETKANPYYVLFDENENGYLKKVMNETFSRRQDCPKIWELNGAIYVINSESIKTSDRSEFAKLIKYEMDEYSSVDIDTQFDWFLAESILKNSLKP